MTLFQAAVLWLFLEPTFANIAATLICAYAHETVRQHVTREIRCF